MAQAQAPEDAGLEQRLLQVLKAAGSPMKAAQLAKECQVPKAQLNQALYRMKGSRVALVGPATWRLAGDVGPEEERTQPGPERTAEPREGACGGGEARPAAEPAENPPQKVLAIPGSPCRQLTERQTAIYALLEARGPLRALLVAQALGMTTAKDVNPDLYALRARHLLDLDESTRLWTVLRPGESGGRSRPATVIYQKNPINVIRQEGPHGRIAIQNCKDIQVGHGNLIVRQAPPAESGAPPAESGAAAPLSLPPPPMPPAGAWGAQDVRVEKSVLRRVQLGNANQMSVPCAGPEEPIHSPPGSPPGSPSELSATAAGPEASFEMRTPQPGAQLGGDAAQTVHIRACVLEDTAIGSSNRMTISPRPAGAEGVVGPTGGKKAAGGLGEAAGAHAGAAPPGGRAPREEGRAAPADVCASTARLASMTLGGSGPEAAGDSRGADASPGAGPVGGEPLALCSAPHKRPF